MERARYIKADGERIIHGSLGILFSKPRKKENLIASVGAVYKRPLCKEIDSKKCAQATKKTTEKDSNVQLVILIHVLLSWLSKWPAIKSHKKREIDINK